MPPPNVTAVLHMGHGLNNTVQDVLIRWRRMCGDEALWVPGTDHAGIATQNVVEKQLAKEGKTRFDLGREAFVARTIGIRRGDRAARSSSSSGRSARRRDWIAHRATRCRRELSRAVREAFVRLYERGLIYRGHRVIHWCPRCLTSLSDEEAEHHETTGKLYHIAIRSTAPVDRGATRSSSRPRAPRRCSAMSPSRCIPTTSATGAHRASTCMLPIANVEIPIIADEYADPAFGTGA